jgi:hypothetical protein
MRFDRTLLVTSAVVAMLIATPLAGGHPHRHKPTATLLVTGLASGSGSTVGPDGALYVTEGATGSIVRVNPRNGHRQTVVTGLPPILPNVGIGGAMDIAFIGHTAYVLVTLVADDVLGDSTVGIYKVVGRNRFHEVADIGTYARTHQPTGFPIGVPTGVQYAMEPYGRGFLVTDGHHNRVYYVTLDGHISEFMTFGNIVPTGLELFGPFVLMAQAGPVPHNPEDGKVVVFGPWSSQVLQIGSGARLLVDIELGRGLRLYGLSQGAFTEGNPDGSPANPNTGALMELKRNGQFETVVDGLDRPTSLEIIGDTAYVVTLGGEIWKISNLPR